MFIQIDSNNKITATARLLPLDPALREQWIEVDDFDDSDLINLKYENGEITVADISVEQTKYIVLVNQKIGEVRSRYITVIPGQEMLYLAKEAEANRYVLDSNPIPTNYPLLSSEVGITGDTLEDVVAVILSLSSEWHTIAADLERLRLQTIKSIKEATTAEQIQQCYEQFLGDLIY